METVANRIQETGHQIVVQRDAFVMRTRDAGIAFFAETRDAGLQLVGAVRTEAKRWQRFANQRVTTIQTELRNGFGLPAAERAVLTRVDGTLKAIDAAVRARLTELEPKPESKVEPKAPKSAKKAASSKAPASRRTKKLPPIAA